jgi:hypothetical protein
MKPQIKIFNNTDDAWDEAGKHASRWPFAFIEKHKKDSWEIILESYSNKRGVKKDEDAVLTDQGPRQRILCK